MKDEEFEKSACLLLCFVMVLGLVLLTAFAAAPGVYVGGVGMVSGGYLAVGESTPTTTELTDSYAYYKDGVLTLKN